MQNYVYVRCFSDTCNNIRFSFYRTRENGRTYYRASAVPVELVKRENGIVFERYFPATGYKATVGSARRASKTALETARRELVTFVLEVMQAFENDGFTPGVFDAYEIAQNIDCEAL